MKQICNFECTFGQVSILTPLDATIRLRVGLKCPLILFCPADHAVFIRAQICEVSREHFNRHSPKHSKVTSFPSPYTFVWVWPWFIFFFNCKKVHNRRTFISECSRTLSPFLLVGYSLTNGGRSNINFNWRIFTSKYLSTTTTTTTTYTNLSGKIHVHSCTLDTPLSIHRGGAWGLIPQKTIPPFKQSTQQR